MRRCFILVLAFAAIAFAQKRPFTASAMMELQRLSDPQISPDGKWVTFGVQTVDVDANRKPQQIWIVPLIGRLAAADHAAMGEANQRARWSPDSKRIAYISDRGGSSQIWLMDPDGGNAKQVTTLSTEADGVVFSPRWQESAVHQRGLSRLRRRRCLQQEAAGRRREQQSQGAHLHRTAVPPLDADGRPRGAAICSWSPVAGGAAKDLTPGNRDVPPFSLGGPDDYDISPDGKEVCYSMNCRPGAGHQHQRRPLRGLDCRRRSR